MKCYVVIPAFNEEKTLDVVIAGVRRITPNIIVVDDGSTDSTLAIAQRNNVICYSHIINRGLGASLFTGIKAALQKNADIIVTFDADSQHNPEDIKRLIEPIEKNEADVVVGSRMLKDPRKHMPLVRVLYNLVGNIITLALFGLRVTDSQSGLRAFSRQAAQKLKIKSNRMEVSSEIIQEVRIRNLRYKEIPIKAIYSDYSLSKGQSFFVGLKTLLKLIVIKFSK
jgi:glycosyltransferase involved in cell wall biosynthesis